MRGRNQADLDRNISEANGEFGTDEYREIMGIMDMREEEEILISGEEMSVEYIDRGVSEEFESDSYEGDEAMFTGMGIAEKRNEVPHRISMGPNGYGGKIKEIS